MTLPTSTANYGTALQAYDTGATIYAVQHWHDSYRYHWGLHATGALSAIDAYLRSQNG